MVGDQLRIGAVSDYFTFIRKRETFDDRAPKMLYFFV